jgi:peptide/nickel transport system substrate-binding protein
MRRIFGVITVVVTALALVVVSSSSGKTRSQSSKSSSGTFIYAVSDDPGNLDPQRSANEANDQVAALAYSTIVILNKNHVVQPAVATKWRELNPRKWAITIRPGVICSDGSTLTAQTVASNINYVGNPKGGSGYTGYALASGTTAKASGQTVTVKLPAPNPFLLQDMSVLPLVCAKGLKDRASLASASDGTGPYQVKSVVPGSSVTYTLRKSYTHGLSGDTASSKLPSEIVVKVVANMTTTANLILNGQINGAIVSGTDQKRLKSVFSVGEENMTDEMFFSHASSEPTADKSVRQALVMGIDRTALAASDTGGLGVPATGMLASTNVCPGNNTKGILPGYSVAAAKALLVQDGWTMGSGGYFTKGGNTLTVSLTYESDYPPAADDAQVIQAEWQQIGVKTTLLGVAPGSVFSSDVNGGKYTWDALLYDIGFQTPAEWVSFLSGEAPPNGENFGAIDNATYNSLVTKALAMPGTSGCAVWNKAEQSLFRNADVAPVAQAPFEYFGKNATFSISGNNLLLPGTIRLH